MSVAVIIAVVVALLLLLGGLLFLCAQFFVRKMIYEKIEIDKIRLWIWRSFIVVLVVYSYFLFLTNKGFLLTIFGGPFEAFRIFLTIFLVVYFVGLMEIIVIDLLLPNVIHMWKRILIEVVVFLLLCVSTLIALHLGSSMLAPLL